MNDILLLIPSFLFGGLLYVMVKDRALERKEWALERIALLQRIQAPEVEVAKYEAEEASDAPLYVPNNDEDWESYFKDRDAGEAV